MKQNDAVKKLTALAHDGRLNLFRRLVEAGPEGESAGNLARFAGVQATTASAQLLILSNAGLVVSHRDGRQIIYRANFEAIGNLIGYLMENCCGGACATGTTWPNKRTLV